MSAIDETLICDACGRANPGDHSFCGACGRQLDSLPPVDATARLVDRTILHDAERRQLSVMFCDLVDSTELAARFDPEEWRAVVWAFQQVSSEVVARLRGHVAQYLGDGLLVYFGYPHAHENDAERAVRAGLGILEAVRELNRRLEREHAVQLAVRIGIDTGGVVIGEFGDAASHQELAHGPTLHRAARLQGLAMAGSLLISATTAELIEGLFVLEDLGLRPLKGLPEPARAFRVVADTGAPTRFQAPRVRPQTPLVGRERESEQLLGRWERARAGAGQTVLLVGEAGIGKSRLVQVLKDRVPAGADGWLASGCSPDQQDTPFRPVLAMLRQDLGWLEEEDPAERLEKLERRLGATFGSDPRARELVAQLLSLPLPGGDASPESGAEKQRREILELLARWLLAKGARDPCVFVIEDLHWSDPSTLELLELLIPRVANAPVLLLLTWRPEQHPDWRVPAEATSIHLARLSPSESVRVSEAVAGGKRLPAEVLHQVVARTDGVPLFIEELTKVVLASGHLRELDDRYELTTSLPESWIPSSLQGSLTERLDRLGRAKEVAQIAAVIGREFRLELLRLVCRHDLAELERALHALVDADLLEPPAERGSDVYVFRHALVRDSAYESLLRRARREIHARVGRALEAQFPETARAEPELLAHHFAAAGLAEPAIAAWHRSGRRASRRSANREAQRHVERAMEILRSLPATPARDDQELSLLITLGLVVTVSEGYAAPAVGTALRRANELCEVGRGNRGQHLVVLSGLQNYHLTRGEYGPAQRLAERVLELAKTEGSNLLIVWGHLLVQTCLIGLGDYQQTLDHARLALGHYDAREHALVPAPPGAADPAVASRCFAALALWSLGLPEQARESWRAALEAARGLPRSHPFTLTWALYFGVWLHWHLGEHPRCLELADECRDLANEHGFAVMKRQVQIIRSGARVASTGAAMEEVEAALREYEDSGSSAMETFYLSILAASYAQSGQAEKGLAVVERAQRVIEENGEVYCEPELERLRGEILLRVYPEKWEDAERCLAHAVDLARRRGARSWELRATVSLARLLRATGRPAAAAEHLRRVYASFEEGFETGDLVAARTFLERAS